jgi:hypothetical protein
MREQFCDYCATSFYDYLRHIASARHKEQMAKGTTRRDREKNSAASRQARRVIHSAPTVADFHKRLLKNARPLATGQSVVNDDVKKKSANGDAVVVACDLGASAWGRPSRSVAAKCAEAASNGSSSSSKYVSGLDKSSPSANFHGYPLRLSRPSLNNQVSIKVA